MEKFNEKLVFIKLKKNFFFLEFFFHLQTICYVVPVKEHRHLTINWVIPDHKDLYYCNVSIGHRKHIILIFIC